MRAMAYRSIGSRLYHRFIKLIPIESLHSFRGWYQRKPSIKYLFSRSLSGELQKYVDALNEDGIVKMEGYISEKSLIQIQEDFAKMIPEIERKTKDLVVEVDGYVEESYKPKVKTISTNNPFKYSSELARICINTKFNNIINTYLRKYAYVHQAVGNRILPCILGKVGSYQWHHDQWGKRVNMMILLSDVGEGDQYTTYVKGSHKLKHSYQDYINSRLDVDYCKAKMDRVDIYEAKGKAGDVILFDPNGLHSGNRTLGNTRDTFIVNYTSDKSYVWGMRLPEEFVSNHNKNELKPFWRVLERNSSKADLIPEYRSWAESLPHLSSWI